MKISLLFVFLVFLVAGCSSVSEKKFSRVNVDMYYRQNGVIKYILAPLPAWANVHEDSKCRRSKSVKYLDLAAINKSFALTYEQAIAFQYYFDNDYYRDIFKAQKDLTLQEEEQVFFAAQDKIKAGLRLFQIPKSDVVNVILVDDYLKMPDGLFASLINSEVLSSGRPILFSFCLTRQEIAQKFSSKKVDIEGLTVISYESLSYFSNDFELDNFESINLNKIVGENKKINIYTPFDFISKSIKGKYKKIIFK